ncbi:MAG: porin [Betaproteobacteria bacterium]|jgi:predicted porin|nr:porin [Betaproteobacteria bacterium]
MKKTLVALAALAATAGASAQVTISGYYGASYDNFSIGSVNSARTGLTSENRVSDQSSRIIFGVREDLGGGLAVIGQYDYRFNLDAAGRAQSEAGDIVPTFTAGGNSHIGLSSGSMGTVRLGRQDIYYVDTPSLLPAGLYLAANQQPVFHSLATANASRTPNLLWWVSPRINGFEGTIAYSTSGIQTSKQVEVESDVGGASTRRGSSTMLRLNYTNGPIDATFANYSGVSDTNGQSANSLTSGAVGATYKTAANNDQKGTTFVLKYQVTPQLRVAAGMSDEKAIAIAAAAAPTSQGSALAPAIAVGDELSARATAWSASYDMGAWNFAIAQSNRGNTKYNGTEQTGTGVSMTSLAATYNLSKRTAAGLMMTTMKNDTNQTAGLFYQSSSAYGGQFATARGETYNITSVALRHNF